MRMSSNFAKKLHLSLRWIAGLGLIELKCCRKLESFEICIFLGAPYRQLLEVLVIGRRLVTLLNDMSIVSISTTDDGAFGIPMSVGGCHDRRRLMQERAPSRSRDVAQKVS